MDKPKLNISWDDLKAPAVEERLTERAAVTGTQQHYASAQVVSSTRPPGMMGWLARAIIYLPLAGLLGALVGWIIAETMSLRPDAMARARELVGDSRAVDRAVAAGRFSADDAARALARIRRVAGENPYFPILMDSTLDASSREQRLSAARAADRHADLTADLMFYCVCGGLIAMMLAAADAVAERNQTKAIIHAAVGASVAVAGAALIAWASPAIESAVGNPRLARTLIWASLGVVISIAATLAGFSLKRTLLAIVGGAVGGAVGGFAYDQLSTGGGAHVGRLGGMVAIGALIGLLGSLAESAARVGWISVTQGLIAGKQFILYRNPTYIGSAPMSHVYLFRDPAVGRRHAAIHHVTGGFEIENLPLGQDTMVNDKPVDRQRLRHGDRIRIGRTTFVFEHRQQSAKA
jgi:hypothetical protein